MTSGSGRWIGVAVAAAVGQPAGHAARACPRTCEIDPDGKDFLKALQGNRPTQGVTYICQCGNGLATLCEPLEEECREDVDLLLDMALEKLLQREEREEREERERERERERESVCVREKGVDVSLRVKRVFLSALYTRMAALRQTHRFDILEVEVDDHIVEKFPLVKPSTVAFGYFKCTLALRRIRRPYGEPARPI